jgi:hypothetical protein
MKNIQLVILILLTSSFVNINDIYDEIGNAIKSANSKQLVSYIGNNVDLTIGSQEAVYSRIQAEQIIRDFFTRNPPKSFIILHKGSSKEGTMYAIGTYSSTAGKNFRTSFYFKHSGATYVIQELRFETE